MTNLMPSKKDRPFNSAHLQFHLRRLSARQASRIAPRRPGPARSPARTGGVDVDAAHVDRNAIPHRGADWMRLPFSAQTVVCRNARIAIRREKT